MTTSPKTLPLGAIAVALGATLLLTAAIKPPPPAGWKDEVPFEFSRIYWEYNASANDLGVHVTLDGEDWTQLRIENPKGKVLFDVKGKGPYKALGMTELFFEGAEPSLDEFPLQDLLKLFPEGTYDFDGQTVDGDDIEGEWEFSHAVPAGPVVSSQVGGNDFLRIQWTAVTTNPPGFPTRPLEITGYQVIVESFQVTVPPSTTSLTISPEFVASLAPGEHPFEVLAIEKSGNQTLTEGTFVK